MTSDERRNVAERLRSLETREFVDGVFCDIGDIVDSLGIEQDDELVRFDGVEQLADLIDPTCKDEADVNPVDGFVCSACGWWGNAQQAWDNGWGEPDFDSPTEYAIRFCPNCGARVVGR